MMDCRPILSASGDQRKGGGVIRVNEGTYVLKNRWTGPEDKLADFGNNSGASVKCRNNEVDLKMKKKVNFEAFEGPRENLDTRLRKLMSGDPESIPVFMLEYRADWIHSERKKRHQNKTNLKKDTTEKRSGDKSSDQKIKLESINTQVSDVEQLLKNVKMTPDLSDKQNETGNGNEIKNYPLEERLRCDYGLISNIKDLNESFTNPLNDNPIREDNNEEIEHRPEIDDVDVDYIVRQLPLEKASENSMKPSSLGSKLTRGSIKPIGIGRNLTRISLKDSKPVSSAIHNPLEEIDSEVSVEKKFDQIKEPEFKHVNLKIYVEGTYSEEVNESHCSTKIENYNEKNGNVTPNELIKVEPKHHIERVPSRKRKLIEVLSSIEDRFTKEAKLNIKTRLEDQIINAAMEKFDKWWEEQEIEHEKKGQGLKMIQEIK